MSYIFVLFAVRKRGSKLWRKILEEIRPLKHWKQNVKSGLIVEPARRRNEEQSVVYEQKNEYSKPVSMIKNNETVPEKQDREMKANRYCPKCGAFVNGSTYCGQCGTKVN